MYLESGKKTNEWKSMLLIINKRKRSDGKMSYLCTASNMDKSKEVEVSLECKVVDSNDRITMEKVLATHGITLAKENCSIFIQIGANFN